MTASEKILRKTLVATGLSSSEIDLVQAGLKDRAFFSARVQSVRFLQGAQQGLGDLLASARNADGALTSRAQLVSDLMRSARENGIATGKGGLTDPGSAKRAAVIVDTNAGLARGYVNYAAGSSKGARAAYPAVELVRIREPKGGPAARRDWKARWVAAGGKLYGGRMICLKGDTVLEKLSRFGVPYPPFDYGSGMGLSDVSFEECVALGILKGDWVPGDENPVQDFNARLEEELTFNGADDPGWQFLRESFGDQIAYRRGKVQWQADLIPDALERWRADPSVKATTMLGRASGSVASEHPDFAGRQLSIAADKVGHISETHVGDAEKDKRNVPLTDSELKLIALVWREPERVARQQTGVWYFERRAADGNILRLVVSRAGDGVHLDTFYKTKGTGV